MKLPMQLTRRQRRILQLLRWEYRIWAPQGRRQAFCVPGKTTASGHHGLVQIRNLEALVETGLLVCVHPNESNDLEWRLP